ncbi:hypothetical protein RJ640_007889 [Escallonia rubra]|uniref:MADS-box domain-containing protein n=1 Tax=Escallonia rubra TaxID=112253 RepID=A0AA88QPC2_9ASTE|nr:hypothetical protein RJ640_007889 [Escallonia rubra]
MGRIKVVLKRLERRRSRQSTYCKRRNGLIKKAHELSKLCEADVALLMFSPSGKPALYHGDNRGFMTELRKGPKGDKYYATEELTAQAHSLRTQLSEIQKKLRYISVS